MPNSNKVRRAVTFLMLVMGCLVGWSQSVVAQLSQPDSFFDIETYFAPPRVAINDEQKRGIFYLLAGKEKQWLRYSKEGLQVVFGRATPSRQSLIPVQVNFDHSPYLPHCTDATTNLQSSYAIYAVAAQLTQVASALNYVFGDSPEFKEADGKTVVGNYRPFAHFPQPVQQIVVSFASSATPFLWDPADGRLVLTIEKLPVTELHGWEDDKEEHAAGIRSRVVRKRDGLLDLKVVDARAIAFALLPEDLQRKIQQERLEALLAHAGVTLEQLVREAGAIDSAADPFGSMGVPMADRTRVKIDGMLDPKITKLQTDEFNQALDQFDEADQQLLARLNLVEVRVTPWSNYLTITGDQSRFVETRALRDFGLTLNRDFVAKSRMFFFEAKLPVYTSAMYNGYEYTYIVKSEALGRYLRHILFGLKVFLVSHDWQKLATPK